MSNDLRDTEEQQNLRALFSKSYGKRNPTTACPFCLPGCKRKSPYFFERGTVEINGETLVAMRCNNCSFIRVSKLRTPSTEPTPAQQAAIDRIRNHYEKESKNFGGVKEFDVKPCSTGYWVSVRTNGNSYLMKGGNFHIGQRGSVEIWSVYDLELPEHRGSEADRLAYYLKAKISKYCK